MKVIDQAKVATHTDPCINADQRKFGRHLCFDGKVIRLSVRPEFRGRRVMLLDLSEGGIGFISEHSLEEGTVIVFELQGPESTTTGNRIARVRHSRAHPVPPEAPWIKRTPKVSKFFRSLLGMSSSPPAANAWLIGCEFDSPLTQPELDQLVAKLRLE